MCTSRRLVSAAAMLAFAWTASAAESDRSLVVGPCDRGRQDNPAFTACLRDELARLDRLVDRYVQAARQGIRSDIARAAAAGSQYEADSYTVALQQLDAAQSRWVDYREAHCTMMAKRITGSGAEAAPYRCKVRLTDARLKEIWTSTSTNLPDPEGAV